MWLSGLYGAMFWMCLHSIKVFSVSQTVPPAVEEAESAEVEGGHNQDSRPQMTHTIECCSQGAQGKGGGGGDLGSNGV